MWHWPFVSRSCPRSNSAAGSFRRQAPDMHGLHSYNTHSQHSSGTDPFLGTRVPRDWRLCCTWVWRYRRQKCRRRRPSRHYLYMWCQQLWWKGDMWFRGRAEWAWIGFWESDGGGRTVCIEVDVSRGWSISVRARVVEHICSWVGGHGWRGSPAHSVPVGILESRISWSSLRNKQRKSTNLRPVCYTVLWYFRDLDSRPNSATDRRKEIQVIVELLHDAEAYGRNRQFHSYYQIDICGDLLPYCISPT